MARFKKCAVMAMAGVMAVTGISVTPLANCFGEVATVLAAGKTYNTSGGIATFGTGTASITVTGNVGQTLVGKKFNVYKLFNAENAKGGESINYTFNPSYAQALKNVVATALSKKGTSVAAADVTEYMVIDYIQSLNTNKVEGATAQQTLEGRYSAFRYFVEELRDELVALNVDVDVVNVNNVKTDNSVQIKGLDYGYYVID